MCGRCCGQNAGSIQLFPSSWSVQKAGNISAVFVTAVWGVEPALALDTCSHLGEEIFRNHLFL